jgi:hypothetical protein
MERMFTENFPEAHRALEIVPLIIPSGQLPDDIRHARVTGRWTFRVIFNDGTEGDINIERLVNSQNAGAFALLRDHELFERAFIQCGIITWPTGNDEYTDLDLAFHDMYDAIKETGIYTPL